MTAPSVCPAETTAGTIGTRLDVQGLRAVAVVLVVLGHVGVPGLAGGFIGVDVFFAVSGFLITALLLREWEATGRIRLGAFFARRARRILPLATVVLVATAGYAAASLPASRVDELGTDVRWSALFLANVHFAGVDGDYFAQDRATSPVQHFWSLGVEEQFYLVWPALLAVVLVVAGLARRRSGAVLTAAVLVVVWCASYAWSVLEMGKPAAYYGAWPRAWELATGALLALAIPLLLRLEGWARTMLAVAGVAAVGLAAARYDAGSQAPNCCCPWLEPAPCSQPGPCLRTPGSRSRVDHWPGRGWSGWETGPTRCICGTGRSWCWSSRRLGSVR